MGGQHGLTAAGVGVEGGGTAVVGEGEIGEGYEIQGVKGRLTVRLVGPGRYRGAPAAWTDSGANGLTVAAS